MRIEPVIGSVEFNVGNVLKPWDRDPEEYYIVVEGKITVLVDDDDVPAGKMELVLIKLAEAHRARVDVYQVFDAHSQALADAYGALFDTRGRFRRRHGIERRLEDLLYVDDIRIHADFDRGSLMAQSVETAISLLAPTGVVFAYAGDLNKYGLRWQKHGFKSAGKSEIILRDNWDVDPEALATAAMHDEL
jgi:hypothetical protein